MVRNYNINSYRVARNGRPKKYLGNLGNILCYFVTAGFVHEQ